jgi:hypothetical protein
MCTVNPEIEPPPPLETLVFEFETLVFEPFPAIEPLFLGSL